MNCARITPELQRTCTELLRLHEAASASLRIIELRRPGTLFNPIEPASTPAYAIANYERFRYACSDPCSQISLPS
jgi:hypothetical protein